MKTGPGARAPGPYFYVAMFRIASVHDRVCAQEAP